MSVADVLYKTKVHAGKGKAATPTRTRSLAAVPLSAVAQHSGDVHWPLPTTGRPEVGNNITLDIVGPEAKDAPRAHPEDGPMGRWLQCQPRRARTGTGTVASDPLWGLCLGCWA